MTTRNHEAIRRVHRVTFVAALLAFLAVVLRMIGPFLLPLFLGGTMALVCRPLYRRLARWMRPSWASLAATALALMLVVAPLAGLSVLAVRQGVEVGQQMAELTDFSPRAITDVLSRSELVRELVGGPAEVNRRLKGVIQSAGQLTVTAVIAIGKSVPRILLQLALAVIAFFFALLDGKRFLDWALGLDLLDRDVQRRLVEAFRETTLSAFVAGLAAASAQSVLIAVGFLALGVPGAFLAGGLTFILSWIPLLGSLPASLGGTLYLYFQGAGLKTALMIALGLAAGVVDNLVRPLVLKGRDDMHPLVGLVVIVGGIEMFGILGVFIGPILAAMLVALLRIWPAEL